MIGLLYDLAFTQTTQTFSVKKHMSYNHYPSLGSVTLNNPILSAFQRKLNISLATVRAENYSDLEHVYLTANFIITS